MPASARPRSDARRGRRPAPRLVPARHRRLLGRGRAGGRRPRGRRPTVLLAVDPTPEVAREAVDWGADLLVTHHPLFLSRRARRRRHHAQGPHACTPCCGRLRAADRPHQRRPGRRRGLGVAGPRAGPHRPGPDPPGGGRGAARAPAGSAPWRPPRCAPSPSTSPRAAGAPRTACGCPATPTGPYAAWRCAAEPATSCSTGSSGRTPTSTSPATCGTTARGGVPRARRARPGRRRPLGGGVDLAAGGAGPARGALGDRVEARVSTRAPIPGSSGSTRGPPPSSTSQHSPIRGER